MGVRAWASREKVVVLRAALCALPAGRRSLLFGLRSLDDDGGLALIGRAGNRRRRPFS